MSHIFCTLDSQTLKSSVSYRKYVWIVSDLLVSYLSVKQIRVTMEKREREREWWWRRSLSHAQKILRTIFSMHTQRPIVEQNCLHFSLPPPQNCPFCTKRHKVTNCTKLTKIRMIAWLPKRSPRLGFARLCRAVRGNRTLGRRLIHESSPWIKSNLMAFKEKGGLQNEMVWWWFS